MRGTDGASMSAQAMEVVGLDTRTMATRSVSDEFTADGVYLNTATMGLPPRRAVDGLHAVLDRWQRGLSDATEFDAAVTRRGVPARRRRGDQCRRRLDPAPGHQQFWALGALHRAPQTPRVSVAPSATGNRPDSPEIP